MKRFLVVLCFLISGLVLVGCTGDNKELKTVSMFGGTDTNVEVYQERIKKFEEETGFKVKDNSSTSDEEWKSRVIADFKNGNEPDVLQFFTGETAKAFVDEGLVMSIEDIRKEYPDYAKNINASVLGTHSVPTTGFVEGIFTNKDHFKSDEAKAYLEKTSWTWDEFKALLAILVEDNKDIEGYKPIAYGIDIPHYWIDHLVAADLGPDYYQEIVKTGGADKLSGALLKLSEIEQYLSKDNQESFSSQAFLDGKYTFQLDGSWFGGRIELTNVTVYPFPELNSTHKTTLLSGFTSGFYITKKAWDNKNKREAAVKFIENMTSTEALSKFVTKAGGFAADDKAAATNETNLSKELRGLIGRVNFTVLPLGDASKTGTYATLVEAQAAFINNNTALAKTAATTYVNDQK